MHVISVFRTLCVLLFVVVMVGVGRVINKWGVCDGVWVVRCVGGGAFACVV